MEPNDDASSSSSPVYSPARSHAHSTKPSIIELDLLEEVKSQFETEAEATILQAIEQAEKERALLSVASVKDRDQILSQVPLGSLHLFGEDLVQESEQLPTVFSLNAIDRRLEKRESLISKSSRSRGSMAARKVQMVQNITNRSRIGSIESGEASVVYHNSTHTRVPSKIPVFPPTSPDFVELMQPIEPTRTAPKLFEIVNRMGEMTRQTTMRNMHNSEYSEVPSGIVPMIESEGDTVDPESLIKREREDHLYENPIAETNIKRESKRATVTRHCCLSFIGFKNFLKLQNKAVRKHVKVALYLLVPIIALAFILYYLAGNPHGPYGATYSWWCLFIARLGITFTLAKAQQFFLIDYIALETSFYVRAFGRIFTLMLIMAKGWPCLAVFWGQWNFMLLYGKGVFAKHWLFWCGDKIGIFGVGNHSSNIQADPTYVKILIVMMCGGVLVTVKRLLLSLLLGKKKYVSYGPAMEKIMRKILLVAEVALLAEDIKFAAQYQEDTIINSSKSPARSWLFHNYRMSDASCDEDEDNDSLTETDVSGRARKNSDVYEFPGMTIDNDADDTNEGQPDEGEEKAKAKIEQTQKRNVNRFINIQWVPFKKNETKKEVNTMLQTSTDGTELSRLLGEWEEPEVFQKIGWGDTSIHKILQFRESLKYLDGANPLSAPFGLADSRKSCCASAQNVFRCLLQKTPNASKLHFDTIAVLALDSDGKLQKDKTRAMIRLLRPDREGYLTELDFVKSCDHLYRRARMFRASTLTAAQLDDAFKGLMNVGFYVVLSFIVMVALGIGTDRIVGISTLFISLSFLFGPSASRYLEGVLLILARQPYDVGDRIAISDPQNDTSTDGSTTWYVENISLFQTTVRLAATNEVATYSNSSLAHSRIINAAKSPKATTYVYLKFGIDIPYSRVMIFKNVVENFVKERPRQYTKLDGFRATVVEADLGYIKYVVVLQHIESWQNIGNVLQAKADVASFCLEVSKKMDMRYIAPPLPIDLSLVGRNFLPGEAAEIGLTNFASTATERSEAKTDSDDGLPPRVPTHFKNDSLGFQSIAAMFAKGVDPTADKK